MHSTCQQQSDQFTLLPSCVFPPVLNVCYTLISFTCPSLALQSPDLLTCSHFLISLNNYTSPGHLFLVDLFLLPVTVEPEPFSLLKYFH